MVATTVRTKIVKNNGKENDIPSSVLDTEKICKRGFVCAKNRRMFQTIGEKVEVAGVYKSATFIPKKLKWGKRVLPIEKITLMSDIKDGGVRKRIYSILCGNELYRLLFNRETEIWILEELWTE